MGKSHITSSNYRKEILLEMRSFIRIKWSVYQEDVSVLNLMRVNKIVSKYTKQKWMGLARKIYKFTIIVDHFNAFLSVTNGTSKQNQ